MFDIEPSEILIVALVAIVLIGPKDLPRVMRFVGQWVAKGRAVTRHFRTAMDDMVREVELQEMEQKWKAENERIMREHADLVSSATGPAQTPATGLLSPTMDTPMGDAPPHDQTGGERRHVEVDVSDSTAPANTLRQV